MKHWPDLPFHGLFLMCAKEAKVGKGPLSLL